MRVAVLAGGVGAARFLEGLVQIIPPADVTAVVNTGDDLEYHGLHISPDLDTVMYTLAGVVNPETGWGIAGDSFACQEMLARYGEDTWFRLGDRDLATHLRRTRLLRAGHTLAAATNALRAALGVQVRLLPMSNDPVRTEILTDDGVLAFQEYFVRRAQRDVVRGVRFRGIGGARPAPGLLDAIAESDAIVIAPSNPFVSVEPILAVDGIRDAVKARRARTVAISPIIGGAAVKGPAGRMLESLGHEVSALGVARLYAGLAGAFILDDVDAALAGSIEELGMRAVVAPTLMTGAAEKRALAQVALGAVGATVDNRSD